jgi:hypothetical protein
MLVAGGQREGLGPGTRDTPAPGHTGEAYATPATRATHVFAAPLPSSQAGGPHVVPLPATVPQYDRGAA